VLLGMSPRSSSVCFINELGSVIPTFWVLSLYVVLFIRILYIVLHSYIPIDIVHTDALSASGKFMLMFSNQYLQNVSQV
jgi:hypothetical protein